MILSGRRLSRLASGQLDEVVVTRSYSTSQAQITEYTKCEQMDPTQEIDSSLTAAGVDSARGQYSLM